jgi:hypothetical protein
MYLVSVDPMDRSSVTEIIFFTIEDKIREIPTQNVFVQVLPTIKYRDCTVVKLCNFLMQFNFFAGCCMVFSTWF